MGYGYNLAAKLPLNSIGFKLQLSNAHVLPLGAYANYLQSVVNWRINVDTTIAGTVTPNGTWTGTVGEVLQNFAIAAGANVTFDDANSTITFSHP